ncbi:MAG: SO_0444 family Cu/Zn efflux transporter [Paludibacteraceae bacterium]|nr:SO_0444 family Cu/Zn efflux transporter [Paludibacteraceae bacterium]MBP5742500.1 SO_0444 family Cu/Zn efflux transporter [Paludibacteraceae bacterium]
MNEIIHLINEMSPYLLLGFLLAGLMHSFIPGGYYTRFLGKKSFRSVVNAALFGIPLPLCSCGVIPTAMSLRKDGASKGAVASFLVATPQTGVDSIIATFSLMGLPFAIVRPIAALLTAVFGGSMVNLTDNSEENSATEGKKHNEEKREHEGFWHKLREAVEYAYVEMMEDIGKWLVIGLVVAGLITVFVPADLFAVFKGNTLASMLLVLCIALPMYLCATGSIPIAVALMMKGLTPGAALVLLMAGPACNFASMLVVKKVLGTRTLVTYLVSIIVGSIAFGYLVDYLQFSGTVNFLEQLTTQQACCEEGDSWFSWACTILMTLLLINAIVLPKLGLRKASQCHCHDEHHDSCSCGCGDGCCDGDEHSETRTYIVEGMDCNHCRASAEKALQQVEGVSSATVDLASKKAYVTGTASEEQLREAIEAIGFKLKKA